MIRFDCPSCGRSIKVKDEGAGRKGKCPGCGETIQIPEQPEAFPDDDEVLPEALPDEDDQQDSSSEAWRLESEDGKEHGPNALATWYAKLPEPGNPLRGLALAEMVKADLERQWKSGRRLTLGSYLERYPELGTSGTLPLGLILREYQLRQEFGESVELSEYLQRFPRQARELEQLIQGDTTPALEADSTVHRSPRQDTPSRPDVGAMQSLAPLSFEQAPGTDGQVPESPLQNTNGTITAPQRACELTGEFGRYRILKKIGQGGMGIVYQARDTQLDRTVALKVPFFSASGRSAVIERFYREARSAAKLRHPNVCPVYDVGEINGVHYLTMAFLEGMQLSTHIRTAGPLPEERAAVIVRRLLAALEEAHRLGIVHRDLKPTNIMLDHNSEPVILDFGLARNMHGEDAQLTQDGAMLGTPAYMSPEQVLGKPDTVGPQSDIYSIGVIFYQLLAGQLPFDGPPTAVYGQILSAFPVPIHELRKEVSPRLAAICEKAMAKNREDRYASANAMAADIDVFVAELRSLRPTVSASGEETHSQSTAVPGSSATDDCGIEQDLELSVLAQEVPRLLDELRGRAVEDTELQSLFASMYDHRPLDERGFSQIRESLTEWADSIPHHKYRQFGQRVKLKAATDYPHYLMMLESQYDTRSVSPARLPYDGRPIPPPAVTAANIDVWSYLASPDDFEPHTAQAQIGGSQRLVACKPCGGHSKVACPSCRGSGAQTCDTCKGAVYVEESRQVERWRQTGRLVNGEPVNVNEQYFETEHFRILCPECGGKKHTKCKACQGERTVACSTCQGHGTQIEALTVTSRVQPEVDRLTHFCSSLTQDFRKSLSAEADYTEEISLRATSFRVEDLKGIPSTSLRQKISRLLEAAENRGSAHCRILGQRVKVLVAHVYHIAYTFENHDYEAYLVGSASEVIADKSPFGNLVVNSVRRASDDFADGAVPKGIALLEKCLEIGHADNAVNPVCEVLRDRLAAAYVAKAHSEGFSAESLYFSDRAQRIRPEIQTALRHEQSVLNRLAVYSFVPGIAVVAIMAAVACLSGLEPMTTLLPAGCSILSPIIVFVIASRLRNTLLGIGYSLVSSMLAVAAFGVIMGAVSDNGTRVLAWTVAAILQAAMLAGSTLCIFRSQYREKSSPTEDTLQNIRAMKQLCAQDWNAIRHLFQWRSD